MCEKQGTHLTDWARVIANGERLPIKLEPGCALLLRTTDGGVVHSHSCVFAGCLIIEYPVHNGGRQRTHLAHLLFDSYYIYVSRRLIEV